MSVVEEIHHKVSRMTASLQLEVLDFVEFLTKRAEENLARREEVEIARAALAAEMRYLDEVEGTDAPVYTIRDIKEQYHS